MSSSYVLLGTGHLSGDHAKTRLQEVHLHLDCPATPISLGERCGPQSTGASLTLQKATEYAFEEHLRACGCDWLRHAALEERRRDRAFTPEEILAYRPRDVSVAEPPVTGSRSRPLAPDLAACLTAIHSGDFEEIESLRDRLNADLVRDIAATWHAGLPWEVKDAYAALLLDRLDDCVRPLFTDALGSPMVETRAYAVCILQRDFSLFDGMLLNGGVDEARVQAAMENLRAG